MTESSLELTLGEIFDQTSDDFFFYTWLALDRLISAVKMEQQQQKKIPLNGWETKMNGF